MPRSLFVVLVYVVVGFAVVLSGTFLVLALIVMNKASSASPLAIAHLSSFNAVDRGPMPKGRQYAAGNRADTGRSRG